MIKQCVICGNAFDAKTSAKYCPACRHAAYLKTSCEWKRQQRQRARLIANKRASLIAKLQASKAKRQAEQLKREQLYPTLSHWDNALPSIALC